MKITWESTDIWAGRQFRIGTIIFMVTWKVGVPSNIYIYGITDLRDGMTYEYKNKQDIADSLTLQNARPIELKVR